MNSNFFFVLLGFLALCDRSDTAPVPVPRPPDTALISRLRKPGITLEIDRDGHVVAASLHYLASDRDFEDLSRLPYLTSLTLHVSRADTPTINGFMTFGGIRKLRLLLIYDSTLSDQLCQKIHAKLSSDCIFFNLPS